MAVSRGRPPVDALDEFLGGVWDAHTRTNPDAERVRQALFPAQAPAAVMDHVAIRTLDHPKLGIERSARMLERHGYQEDGERLSDDGMRTVRRYVPPVAGTPSVFICELHLAALSRGLRDIVGSLARQFEPDALDAAAFALGQRPWHAVLHESYERLHRESPFAAWVAAFGPAPEHVTIRANALHGCTDLEAVAVRLAAAAIPLDTPAGWTLWPRGDSTSCATMRAAIIPVAFGDGIVTIAGGHCEFVFHHGEPASRTFADALGACADWLDPDDGAAPEPGI